VGRGVYRGTISLIIVEGIVSPLYYYFLGLGVLPFLGAQAIKSPLF
jgi:hypothetical protein